jgi:predicted branched-subunit amino acid permease
MAFWLTDETFAVVAGRYAGGGAPETRHWYYLGSAVSMYTNWQVCSFVGAVFGNLIPGAADWGLDFAMPVAFIGMLVPYLRNLPMVSASVVAGAAALLAYGLPNKLGLILAAAAGIAAGFGADLFSGFKPRAREDGAKGNGAKGADA